jgi:hypothetical protein
MAIKKKVSKKKSAAPAPITGWEETMESSPNDDGDTKCSHDACMGNSATYTQDELVAHILSEHSE